MTTEINKHEITRGDNLDMTISPYNPEEIPEGYFYGKRSLRDRFGRNVSKYVHRCHNEQGPVDIV